MSNLVGSTQKSAFFVRKSTSSSQISQDSKTSPENPAARASTSNILNIAGTKTSLQNNQLLTPIGIPSIDSFIGGGLPVGSVCLVGQDKFNTYTDIISRCYVAEGLVHKHHIYVADLNEDITHLLQRIPTINKQENESVATEKKLDTDELRISWRYAQYNPNQNSEDKLNKSLQANYFTINKLMSEEEVSQTTNVASFKLSAEERGEMYNFSGLNPLYVKLANDITTHLDSINMNINKTKKYTNICRVVINSIGGLLWNDKSTFDEDCSASLCRLILYLKTLLRHSLAVIMITVPNEILHNVSLMQKLSHLSDFVFSMDDSKSTASKLTKTEYDGLFRLSKLPCLNSLSSFQPETLDLAFYLKRKRLVVEQLHLPPDLGEGDETQKGRTSSAATMSCSSSGGSTTSAKAKLLDF